MTRSGLPATTQGAHGMSAEAEQQIQRVLAEHDWRWASMRCQCDWIPNGPSLTAAHHAPMTTLQPRPSDRVLAAHRAHVAAKVAGALAAQVPERDECGAALADGSTCARPADHSTYGPHYNAETIASYTAQGIEIRDAAAPAQVPDISARVREILDNPNGGPVEVGFGRGSRHMHAEPICAHPSCQTYLAPDRMALERIRALLDRPNRSE